MVFRIAYLVIGGAFLLAGCQTKEEYYPDNATEIPANYESYLQQTYEMMKVPANFNAYAYMFSSAITKEGSPQIELIRHSNVDKEGFLRIGEYYLAAMGKYYGSVGTKLRITTETMEYKVIIADQKQTAHTLNGNNKVGLDYSIIEFVVDKQVFKWDNVSERYANSIIRIEKEELQ